MDGCGDTNAVGRTTDTLRLNTTPLSVNPIGGQQGWHDVAFRLGDLIHEVSIYWEPRSWYSVSPLNYLPTDILSLPETSSQLCDCLE